MFANTKSKRLERQRRTIEEQAFDLMVLSNLHATLTLEIRKIKSAIEGIEELQKSAAQRIIDARQ